MKGLGIGVLIGIVIVILVALILVSKPFPKSCTEEAKLCPDGSYVGRDPLRNCEFKPCPSVSTTTTTRISQTQIKNLDDVSKNPAYYVGSQITLEGYVVKNVGAFFGRTYVLQSLFGIKNFKSLAESPTGIDIVGKNFEQFVSYTFDGKKYEASNPREIMINGIVKDIGPVTDVSRYYVEVESIEISKGQLIKECINDCVGKVCSRCENVEPFDICINTCYSECASNCTNSLSSGATIGPPVTGVSCFSNPIEITLSGIVSSFSSTQNSASFILTLLNSTKMPVYIRSRCLGGFGIECASISYVGYVPKNGDNVAIYGVLWPGEIKSPSDCPNPPLQYLEAANITLQ